MANPIPRTGRSHGLDAPAEQARWKRLDLSLRLFNLRMLGPASIGILVIALAAAWAASRPAGPVSPSYTGQFLAAEAVLLLSIALALVSTLRWVEPWFDGIDRAMVWHRRVAMSALILLVAHIAITTNPHPSTAGPALAVTGMLGLVVLAVWAILPRWQSIAPAKLHSLVLTVRRLPGVRWVSRLLGNYERWRVGHRFTGLFVASGFTHGLLDGTAFDVPLPRWSFVAVGGTGLAFYLYRELLARFFVPLHDYQVATVQVLDGGYTEIGLRPLGRRLAFIPGQFAMLYLEAKDGWHRHPFTISSAPEESTIRFAVKALGDDTSRARSVKPGMPAILGGAHGRFTYLRGTQYQAWIAGGIGITPFLSWLRGATNEQLPERVYLFYSGNGPAPWADEIHAIAARHPCLHAYFIDTRADGRLTPERVLTTAAIDPRQLSVFMCGPKQMLDAFEVQLHRGGVRSLNIHREHYDWR